MSKLERILGIIADADVFANRPLGINDEGTIAFLCDYINVITKGTKYEGDTKELLHVLKLDSERPRI